MCRYESTHSLTNISMSLCNRCLLDIKHDDGWQNECSGTVGKHKQYNHWPASLEKSLSSRILENQFSSHRPCPHRRKLKSSKIFHDWIGLQWLSDKWVAYLPLCPGQVQVHVNLTVLPHSSVVVLGESPCPRGSPRTNFRVLVLVRGHKVLVHVLDSEVLDNNTADQTVVSAADGSAVSWG